MGGTSGGADDSAVGVVFEYDGEGSQGWTRRASRISSIDFEKTLVSGSARHDHCAVDSIGDVGIHYDRIKR